MPLRQQLLLPALHDTRTSQLPPAAWYMYLQPDCAHHRAHARHAPFAAAFVLELPSPRRPPRRRRCVAMAATTLAVVASAPREGNRFLCVCASACAQLAACREVRVVPPLVHLVRGRCKTGGAAPGVAGVGCTTWPLYVACPRKRCRCALHLVCMAPGPKCRHAINMWPPRKMVARPRCENPSVRATDVAQRSVGATFIEWLCMPRFRGCVP